jgi:carbamoyl-phosphate synthase large subunit
VKEFNVLLSSAGRRVALLRIFRQALRNLGLKGKVLATDMSRLSSAFHDADIAFTVPRCTSSEFIPAMLEICNYHSVGLLVPTIDTELPALAAARQEFAAIGTVVAVSSSEFVKIGGNKLETHRWLVGNGFPTVRQEFVDVVLEHPEEWSFPFLVKPAGGSSSIGVSVVHDREQLKVCTKGEVFVAQSIAPGVEYTVDVLADRSGRCLCAVPRRRLEVRSGEVSKGMTVKMPALEDLATRFCEALSGAYGCMNVQIIYDSQSGEMSVIELNPRFGGGFPLSWEAGAHYPRWIIEEILGLPSTVSATGWRDRLVMLRFDDSVFVDADEAGVE